MRFALSREDLSRCVGQDAGTGNNSMFVTGGFDSGRQCRRRAQGGAAHVGLAGVLVAGCYAGLGTGVDGGDAASAETGSEGPASGGGESGGSGVDVTDEELERVMHSGLRRLTVREYDATVHDLLQADEFTGVQQLPVDPLTPFDNDYTEQIASSGLIDPLDFLAARAADELAADPARRAALVGCEPTSPGDESCMRQFIQGFGRRALRRPLTQEEIEEYLHGTSGNNGALDHAIAADDFYVGIDSLVRVMLQEPDFIYRVELGSPVPGQPGVFELSQFELATRISYFLLGTTPSDELLDLAEAGELRDPASVRQVAESLLSDPRALARIGRFHAMWLGYAVMPHGGELAAAMQEETNALLSRVILEERLPWYDLFRLTETYVSDLLAENYGLPNSGSEEPKWVDWGETGRRGLLSQGTFLSVGGKANDTSPVARGKVIRERLMCQTIPDPPPAVDVDQVPEEGVCKVERYAVHRANGCEGCRSLMDPLGFGLENYDTLGRYREFEIDNPETADVDESTCAIPGEGEITGVGTFRGPAELATFSCPTVGSETVRRSSSFALSPVTRRSTSLIVASPPRSHRRQVRGSSASTSC